MESARAGLRDRCQTMPKPMRNCTSAKTLLASTGLWYTFDAFQVIECATQLGLLAARLLSMPLKPFDPRVNMNGCSWRTASRSQTVARTSWKVRWRSLGCSTGPLGTRGSRLRGAGASPVLTSVMLISHHP